MKLRRTRIFAALLLTLVGLILLSACGTSAGSLSPQPAPGYSWAPPTPFPPMSYATAEPTPALPDGLQGHLPINSPANPVQYAPIKGKIQQDLLEVEKDTASIRGLDPTGDIEEHFIDKDQLRSNMLKLQNENYTREDARRSEVQLWLLRFISEPSLDLFQLQAGMLSNQIAGYYDPSMKQLFVVGGTATLDADAKASLAHEYVHGLQDQHFDLQSLLSPANNSSVQSTDHNLAVKSLVEGDATLSEILYADQYLSANEFDRFVQDSLSYSAPAGQVPDIYEAELQFPYSYGTTFVKYLYERGGFASVNQAFANPPASTEQIMHPEKYLSAQRDEPLPVGVPPLTDTLGTGWTYRTTETLGEFELGVLLKDNSVKDTGAAVEGWGGGQVDLYENGANSLVILGTRWDTQKDALEFDNALRRSLALVGRYGPDWSDGIRYFNLKRFQDKVFYVGSTDQSALKRALDAVK